MENFDDLPLDIRLGAYLDGELDPAQTAEVEALLASDADARALLAALKSGSSLGNEAFEAMLRAPAPLHLARAIREQSNRQTSERRPAFRFTRRGGKPSWFGVAPRALAASAVLLLAGGVSGFLIGQHQADGQFASEDGALVSAPAAMAPDAKTRSFTIGQKAAGAPLAPLDITDLASLHSVYARERSRAAEMPAADVEMMRDWLSKSASVAFMVPDLVGEGLVFEGGRLVALDGKPAIALFYRNDRREIFGVYFARGATKSTRITSGKTSVLSGAKGNVAWFVAGPNDPDLLDQIAAEAQKAV